VPAPTPAALDGHVAESVFLTPDRGYVSFDVPANATLVVVDGGHAPGLNRPDETCSAVSAFPDDQTAESPVKDGY
jgi:hypothetical protein